MLRIHRGSVLPRIAAERTRDGTLLRAARPTRGDVGTIVVYAFVMLAFGGTALIPKGGIGGMAARAFQAAAAFTLFLGALTTYLRRRRLGRATLLLGHWPLRLGDTVSMRFRAMLKKSAPVTEVAAKFQCVEQVIIGGGREQRKPWLVVYEQELGCARRERHIIEEEWTITVPPDLPPSFDTVSSKIEWKVIAMLGDVPAEFLLLVTPQ